MDDGPRSLEEGGRKEGANEGHRGEDMLASSTGLVRALWRRRLDLTAQGARETDQRQFLGVVV